MSGNIAALSISMSSSSFKTDGMGWGKGKYSKLTLDVRIVPDLPEPLQCHYVPKIDEMSSQKERKQRQRPLSLERG